MELIEKVKNLRETGMSFNAIAKQLGLSKTMTNNIYHGRLRKYRNEPTTEDKVSELREKGMLINEIARKLKLNRSTVSGYTAKMDIVIDRKSRIHEAVALSNQGLIVSEIGAKMGLANSTIYHYLCTAGVPVNRAVKAVGEKKALCKCLYIDGYSKRQIVDITGLLISTVNSYLKGVKPPVNTKLKVMKKKKVKSTPTQMEQRDVLGKGVESGVYSTDVKLREDRDNGRIVTVRYKDYGGSIKTIDIRVRDGASDDQARERWCKKFGKEFVC